MLSHCLAATFCVNETSGVTDRHRSILSSDHDQDDNMSSNHRQVLLAGEYAQRRLLSRTSPLAVFKSQLEAQQSPSMQSNEQQQQQQHKQDELNDQEEKQQERQLEWPEQDGVDATMLLNVDPMCIQLGREIGKGAFSIVYAGAYRGKQVAVKCQPTDAHGTIPAFVLREVQVLRLLHHPRLLQFLGAAENVHARQVWIVSEYLNNGDVDLLLKAIRAQTKRHLGWHGMAQIALDAAQGIEFLQVRHIVHRDIKASNILLDDEHRAKVCDFGFAVMIKPAGAAESEASKQHRKSYCGTDAYMAPEMFLDEEYDQSVDIFSFGVVLMEILCCRVANSDGFLMRLPQFKFQVSLAEFRAALPASCPPALATLAEQCVSFEPSERPNIKTIVRTLENVLKHIRTSHHDVVELVPFTPEKRELKIGAGDDAKYGEANEDGSDDDDGSEEDDGSDDDDDDDDDDGEEEDNDEDIEEEEEERTHKLQINGRHNTMGMESDEEERSMRSQVVDDPFLDERSVGSDVTAQPASAAPYYEGVILKRSRRGKRTWVEKRFIVDHDQLHYTDVPPRWQQHQQQNSDWRCTLLPISSLSLRECRIWKTREMSELQFNLVDNNWKIKRELQAVSKRDLELWIELINQAINYANEHDTKSISTTGASVSSSNASRLSRNKVNELQPRSQEPSKPLDQRPKAKSVIAEPRMTRRRSSVTKFDEPPELPETAEDRVDEVYIWLKQIGFQRYTSMLKAKGFTSLDFIREVRCLYFDPSYVF